MWSYYGSKANVVQHYPPPKEYKIIEPFAGSARYALRYFEKEVVLVDKYAVVVNIWKWLQQCSPGDILGLPRMQYQDHVDNFQFDCQEAKDLMGFLIGFPTDSPRKTVTVRILQRPNCINYSLGRIAKNLFKIKHWQIINSSYEYIPNEKATWFIDPPYQLQGGDSYKESGKRIDFNNLSQWCQDRNGQTIVCEATGATWLNFKPLTNHKTWNGLNKEVIWTNQPTSFDNLQLTIF